MLEKKHIDRLFQEKFKDFEDFPDNHVWKNIKKNIIKKKKRRILPLWLRFAGAAAILLLLISSGIWFFNQNATNVNIQNNTPIITNTKSTSDIKKTEPANEVITDIEPQKEANDQINQENFKTTTKQQVVYKKDKAIQSNKNIQQTKKEIIKQPIPNSVDNIVAKTNNSTKTKEKQSIFIEESESKRSIAINNTDKNNSTNTTNDITNALAENEDIQTQKKNNIKKWTIGSIVSPVYFNTLSKGSPIDESLANNAKSSNTSISYGIKVNYKISDRFSLQSGINSVELAYETENVTTLISSNPSLTQGTNLNTNVNGFNIVAISNNADVNISNELLAPQRGGILNLTGNLNQSMQYLEIPLEAKYKIIQQKLGVNVVGGLSTYVLHNNKVSISNQNGETTLGEASNINDVNFSGNLGLDFDYKINKKLFINVSPMFKYQFNIFSKNDGGFQPYFLGIYTGLNFRF